MTIATSHGWAILTDDGIEIITVSETRRAAIVNWIVTAKGQMVVITASTEAIESYWQHERGNAEAVEVTVTHVMA